MSRTVPQAATRASIRKLRERWRGLSSDGSRRSRRREGTAARSSAGLHDLAAKARPAFAVRGLADPGVALRRICQECGIAQVVADGDPSAGEGFAAATRLDGLPLEIGHASRRARVRPPVYLPGAAVSLKKPTHTPP